MVTANRARKLQGRSRVGIWYAMVVDAMAAVQ